MPGWFFLGLAAGLVAGVPAAVWLERVRYRRVRQRADRQRLAERLREISTMTGGLAHEIKNPLSTMSLNLQLLREDLGELRHAIGDGELGEQLDRSRRRLDALGRENQRLKDILDDFLRFAGRMQLDRAPADVNQLLEELVDFFAPQADAAGVQIRTRFEADPPFAPVDAGLLKQAILNLMLNGTQAMAEARREGGDHGGARDLMIATACQRQAGGDPRLSIHVTDTGPGMPAEVAQRVFEPYYSTRRGGSGLGLPTTRRIIEEHGGQITVHSEPGRGTDFFIDLPMDAEKA